MVETQVGTDKKVISTHFSTFITPRVVMVSCWQLSSSKINGKCATLRQDSKACKEKLKIQCWGIKKEIGGPRKVKGHPKRQPCSSSCIAWLCWKVVTKLLMLLNSWSFHFVVLLKLTNLSIYFRELISCTVDGYSWRIWIRHFFSFIRGIFSDLCANLADMQCSIVYEIQEWTNNCLSLCCAMCIASNHSKWRSTRLIF